MPSVANRSMH